MKDFREIYNELAKSVSANPLSSAWPRETDDLLREHGIDVRGSDGVQLSIAALLVLFAMRIKELEERIAKLEN